MTQIEIEQLVTLILACSSLLYGCWRFIVRPFLQFCRNINSQSKAIQKALPSLLSASRPSSNLDLLGLLNSFAAEISFNSAFNKITADHAKIAFFKTDAEGNCLFVSKYWTILTGLDDQDALGTGWINGIHPEDRSRTLMEWESAVRAKRSFDMLIRTATNITIHSHSYPVHSVVDKTKLLGYIGFIVPLIQESEGLINVSGEIEDKKEG